MLGACNTIFRVVAGYIADLPKVDSVLVHNLSVIIAGVATCLVCFFNNWQLLAIYAGVFGACIGMLINC